MKKFFAIVLSVLMVLSLAACSGKDNTTESGDKKTDAPKKEWGDTLRVGVDGEPDSLFAAKQQNKSDNRVNSSLFNYLVEWDDEAKAAKPSLATSWEWVGDDYTKIRFTLRDDVYFSNGEKMVGEDVTESLRYSCVNHANYTVMFDPDNFVVEDDTHVLITLSQPYPNLIDCLGCDYYTVFDWSAFKADVDAKGQEKAEAEWMRNPIGTGPYILKEWKDGDHITLVRNEKYWDKENMPYFAKIEYYFIGDPAARVSALEAGTIDVSYNLPVKQIAEMESKGLTVNPYEENVAQPLSINMRNNPALADELVRKAIFYAIDKNALADAYHQGKGSYSKSPLTGQTSPYYYECENFSQDLDVAKAALAEAKAKNGWTDKDLTFTLWHIAGTDKSQVELLQFYLGEIGITINIEEADFATVLFEHLFKGDSTIGFGENDLWDTTRMLDLVDNRVPTSWNAYVGEHEQELYDLIDAAKAASGDARKEAYNKVQQFCADHYVVTTVDCVLLPDAWANGLTGMKYDAHCWPNVWAMHPVD